MSATTSASLTEQPLRHPDSSLDFTRHRGPVTCVAGIPGKSAAVTSGYDSAVGYVELRRGRLELMGYHDHLVNRIVVNDQGSCAASCSSDYTIKLWDLNTRQPLRTLLGHWDDVEDFAFVSDEVGISASRDYRIIQWNLRTGAVERILEAHEKDVLAVEYAGGRIYSSGDDMTLRQWDQKSGSLLRTWGPFEQETDTCAIDPRHGRVVLGADDGCIRVFDSYTGAALETISAHRSGIKKVAVSPVSGDILSAAYDQQVLIWDAGEFDLKVALEGHPAVWERSFNWTPDGTGILAGTFDGTVLEWDAGTGKRVAEIGWDNEVSGNACFNDVAAGTDGTTVMVSDDGLVRLAQLGSEAAAWTTMLQPRSGRVLMNAVTLGPAGDTVVTGAHDQKLHIFELRDGELGAEREVAIGEGPVNCVRIRSTPEFGDEAFVACYSGAIVRVSLDGEVRGRIRVHEGAVKAVRIHPHEPLGVSCGADGLLLSWTLDGDPVQRFHGHTAIIDDVDFDPDWQFIASASRDFTLKVYEFNSGRTVNSIALGHYSPKSVLFWDRDTVFVGNYWGELLRVDLGSERITRQRIADNGISALSRAGTHLVAVSYDGSVALVVPDNLTVVQSLSAMVQRTDRRPDTAVPA